MLRRAHVLAQMPLFADLTERELADILNVLEEGDAARGATLIAEGAPPGTPLHVLWHGSTATMKQGVDGRSHNVGTLYAPGVFGEMDVLACRPALAGVVALERVRYATLSAAAVRTLCEAARPSILKVLVNLASTLRYRTAVSQTRLEGRYHVPIDFEPTRLGSVRHLLYSGWHNRRS